MTISTAPTIIILIFHERATVTAPQSSGESLHTRHRTPSGALDSSDAVRNLDLGLPYLRRSRRRDLAVARVRRGKPFGSGEQI